MHRLKVGETVNVHERSSNYIYHRKPEPAFQVGINGMCATLKKETMPSSAETGTACVIE